MGVHCSLLVTALFSYIGQLGPLIYIDALPCIHVYANVHQSHSQNDSGDLRGVAGGDGELGCLCGKAGTSHLCDGSAHSSGCVVNGSNAMAAV